MALESVNRDYNMNELVIIHGLDTTGQEYSGKVVGLAQDGIIKVFIVEVGDQFAPEYPWTHAAIPMTNLRRVLNV